MGADPWGPPTGSEQVILGDLSTLTDGGPVQVLPDSETDKVADAPASKTPRSNQQPEAGGTQSGSTSPTAPTVARTGESSSVPSR